MPYLFKNFSRSQLSDPFFVLFFGDFWWLIYQYQLRGGFTKKSCSSFGFCPNYYSILPEDKYKFQLKRFAMVSRHLERVARVGWVIPGGPEVNHLTMISPHVDKFSKFYTSFSMAVNAELSRNLIVNDNLNELMIVIEWRTKIKYIYIKSK